jgi:hypothetical protein
MRVGSQAPWFAILMLWNTHQTSLLIKVEIEMSHDVRICDCHAIANSHQLSLLFDQGLIDKKLIQGSCSSLDFLKSA